MRTLLLMLVLACGGKQSEPAPLANVSTTPPPDAAVEKSDEDRILEAMAGFRDGMCKCAAGDVECAKRVSDAMLRWGEAQAKPQDQGAPVTMKRQAEAEQVGQELGECMTRAMTPVDATTGAGSATP